VASSYREQRKAENELKVREIQKELPPIVGDFMRSILTNSDLTRLGYIQDLRTFFYFLTRELPDFADVSPAEVTVEQLGNLKLREMEMYKEYLHLYKKPVYGRKSKEAVEEEGAEEDDDKRKTDGLTKNDESGMARKLCSLRAFFKYLYMHELIEQNVTEKLKVPPAPKKEIIYLNKEEIARVLHIVQTGEGMSERQKKYQESMRVRDVAILFLLLGTGIRASELVGMDIESINFEKNSFFVDRKGNKEMTLSFNSNVANALKEYMQMRQQIIPCKGHEHALFLSTQKKRLTVRALQNLVQKYAKAAVPDKQHLSPHKMRSSFGTALYEKSGDIDLVAEVLGHTNVNTTKKHYIHENEKRREEAAGMVDWTE